MITQYVYAISCSERPSHIRYIGTSSRPRERAFAHAFGGDNAWGVWNSYHRLLGVRLNVYKLASKEFRHTRDAVAWGLERERTEIERHALAGSKLFNTVHCPKSLRVPTRKGIPLSTRRLFDGLESIMFRTAFDGKGVCLGTMIIHLHNAAKTNPGLCRNPGYLERAWLCYVGFPSPSKAPATRAPKLFGFS